MPVVATAGHVDHGKSTLVRALTGRDPDRWEEEQRRGMTIDLGFAWTEIAGREVGFIDVPGHERFVKNMLAGVEGIDAAMFVVAADEGWMPQSEEHLAVLDLIGVSRGVVALTRTDLVDEEAAGLVALDVTERLAGTSLEGAEVVPVSAPTGLGLERLRSVLGGLLGEAPNLGSPRLWVDRAFTISGAGTVVTGTLLGGALSVGEVIAVQPQGDEARIRGLQTHERTVDRIDPGNRAAVNLAGVERTRIARGSMLGLPGRWRVTDRLLADLRPVRTLAEPLTGRGSFHAHIGSGSGPARVQLLAADAEGVALVTLTEGVPMAAGDRIVLREVGRRAVVAGGIVLDPHPERRRPVDREALEGLRRADTPDARATALLRIRGVEQRRNLVADTWGGVPTSAVDAGEELLSPAAAADLEAGAVSALDRFHRENPLRPGMPLPAVAGLLGVTDGVLAAVVAGSSQLEEEGPVLRLASFRPRREGAGAQAWDSARETLRAAGAAPPRRSELGLTDEVMHSLLRDGELVAVGDEFVYLPETLEEVVTATITLGDGFGVAAFRDSLGITRKHAVPLLEWLDASGITRRQGDLRTLRSPR